MDGGEDLDGVEDLDGSLADATEGEDGEDVGAGGDLRTRRSTAPPEVSSSSCIMQDIFETHGEHCDSVQPAPEVSLVSRQFTAA